MIHVYETTGGWNIEVEYSYHKGTTPAGGDDPENLEIEILTPPYGLKIHGYFQIGRFCRAFEIDLEAIELEILDENR